MKVLVVHGVMMLLNVAEAIIPEIPRTNGHVEGRPYLRDVIRNEHTSAMSSSRRFEPHFSLHKSPLNKIGGRWKKTSNHRANHSSKPTARKELGGKPRKSGEIETSVKPLRRTLQVGERRGPFVLYHEGNELVMVGNPLFVNPSAKEKSQGAENGQISKTRAEAFPESQTEALGWSVPLRTRFPGFSKTEMQGSIPAINGLTSPKETPTRVGSKLPDEEFLISAYPLKFQHHLSKPRNNKTIFPEKNHNTPLKEEAQQETKGSNPQINNSNNEYQLHQRPPTRYGSKEMEPSANQKMFKQPGPGNARPGSSEKYTGNDTATAIETQKQVWLGPKYHYIEQNETEVVTEDNGSQGDVYSGKLTQYPANDIEEQSLDKGNEKATTGLELNGMGITYPGNGTKAPNTDQGFEQAPASLDLNKTGATNPETQSIDQGNEEAANPQEPNETGATSPGSDHGSNSETQSIDQGNEEAANTQEPNETGAIRPGSNYGSNSETQSIDQGNEEAANTQEPNETGAIRPGSNYGSNSETQSIDQGNEEAANTQEPNETGATSPGSNYGSNSETQSIDQGNEEAANTQEPNQTGATTPGIDQGSNSETQSIDQGNEEAATAPEFNETGTTSPGIDHSSNSETQSVDKGNEKADGNENDFDMPPPIENPNADADWDTLQNDAQPTDVNGGQLEQGRQDFKENASSSSNNFPETPDSDQPYVPVDEFGSPLYGNETDDYFQREALEAHNRYRAIHSSPPLELNDYLSNEAQQFAKFIADLGATRHEVAARLMEEHEGENVARGCSGWGGLTASGAIRRWYSEVCTYDWTKRNLQPESRNFMQIVWKGTKQLGIGRAHGTHHGLPCTFVVARYKPGLPSVIASQKDQMTRGIFTPSYCNNKDTDRLSSGYQASVSTEEEDPVPEDRQTTEYTPSSRPDSSRGVTYLPLATWEKNIDSQDVSGFFAGASDVKTPNRFLPQINPTETRADEDKPRVDFRMPYDVTRFYDPYKETDSERVTMDNKIYPGLEEGYKRGKPT